MCSGVRRQCLIKAALLGVFQGKDGSQSNPHLLPVRTRCLAARVEQCLVFRCERTQACVKRQHRGFWKRKGQDAWRDSKMSEIKFSATLLVVWILTGTSLISSAASYLSAHDLQHILFYYC